MVAWSTPGVKYVNLTVTDNDGAQSIAQVMVQVLNQLPVAQFEVRDSVQTAAVCSRVQDGQVDVPCTNGRTSYDPDGLVGDSSDLEFLWTFSDGTTSNDSLVIHNFATHNTRFIVVIDENGMQSEERTLSIRIQNPKPIVVKIFDIWYDGDLVTTSTPIAERHLSIILHFR